MDIKAEILQLDSHRLFSFLPPVSEYIYWSKMLETFTNDHRNMLSDQAHSIERIHRMLGIDCEPEKLPTRRLEIDDDDEFVGPGG
jgi:hypothetical protein